jgi:PPOX class probable F420-dependent enzyme
MSKLTALQQAFLRENPFLGVLTTLRPDGTPHSTPVWVDEDGGDVLVNTVVGRRKERNMQQNPNVSLTFVDPENAYHWVTVTGRATLDTEGARDHIDKLSRKYLGKDYPWHKETDQRIIARVKVDKVDATGFD